RRECFGGLGGSNADNKPGQDGGRSVSSSRSSPLATRPVLTSKKKSYTSCIAERKSSSRSSYGNDAVLLKFALAMELRVTGMAPFIAAAHAESRSHTPRASSRRRR